MAAIWFTDAQPFGAAADEVPSSLRGSCERLVGSLFHGPVWLVRVAGVQPDVRDEAGWQLIGDLSEQGSVLLDLTQLELSDEARALLDPLSRMLDRVSDPDGSQTGRMAVVCSRESVRNLLSHLRPSPVMFRSRGDALQAIVMAGDGLGPGWASGPSVAERPVAPRPASLVRAGRTLRLVQKG